jgi:hypothetical protein
VSNTLQPNQVEANIVSTIIGIGDERSVVISEWIGELESNCSKTRGIALASQLGEALESYVGVDKEILAEAFARTIHNRPRRDLPTSSELGAPGPADRDLRHAAPVDSGRPMGKYRDTRR